MNAHPGRMRWAAVLVLVGLFVESMTLLWSGPSAFLSFIIAGALMVLTGIVLAARALWSTPGNRESTSNAH